MTGLPEQLRTDLTAAMRARDQAAVRALRSVLAALANAEAPPIEVGGAAGAIEDAAATSEHARVELTDDDHRRILAAEVAEREAAAAGYDAVGQAEAAAALRAELTALAAYR